MSQGDSKKTPVGRSNTTVPYTDRKLPEPKQTPPMPQVNPPKK